MLRSVASKVAWVGRTASMVFGLALLLALVVGVASMALGATGDNFILGNPNVASAITKLTGNVSGGPALQVVNNNTAAGSRGLQVNVAEGKPPIVVNATAGKATNLNADKLDGLDSSEMVPRPRYITSKTIASGGGGVVAGALITCDKGDVVLSGGGEVHASEDDDYLRVSKPRLGSTFGPVQGWEALYRDNGAAGRFTVHILCADYPPLH